MELKYINNRLRKILEFIDPKQNEKILVIGTGVYPEIEELILLKVKCKIISGDIDKKNLENAKKVLKSVEFVELDAQKTLPFKNSYFNKVILTEVLEHLKDENIVLSEIRRVLKPSGRLILSVPKKRWFNIFNPISYIQHEREYIEEHIKDVLNNNKFKIRKMFVGGSVFDLFNLWIHLILKYVFKKLWLKSFFKKQIDRSWKDDFEGKGTDIVILAERRD